MSSCINDVVAPLPHDADFFSCRGPSWITAPRGRRCDEDSQDCQCCPSRLRCAKAHSARHILCQGTGVMPGAPLAIIRGSRRRCADVTIEFATWVHVPRPTVLTPIRESTTEVSFGPADVSEQPGTGPQSKSGSRPRLAGFLLSRGSHASHGGREEGPESTVVTTQPVDRGSKKPRDSAIKLAAARNRGWRIGPKWSGLNGPSIETRI